MTSDFMLQSSPDEIRRTVATQETLRRAFENEKKNQNRDDF
jgi:hypothetical protein